MAGVGLFGVLSYSVAQRTRELGVRLALGARPGAVARLVVGQGVGITGVGLVLGGAVALWAGRFAEPLLFATNGAGSPGVSRSRVDSGGRVDESAP